MILLTWIKSPTPSHPNIPQNNKLTTLLQSFCWLSSHMHSPLTAKKFKLDSSAHNTFWHPFIVISFAILPTTVVSAYSSSHFLMAIYPLSPVDQSWFFTVESDTGYFQEESSSVVNSWARFLLFLLLSIIFSSSCHFLCSNSFSFNFCTRF